MKGGKYIAWLLLFGGGWLVGGTVPAMSASLMIEKNLFAPDRKPPSPEAVAAPAQSNKPGLTAKAVQLDGVFIRGDTRKAILRMKGQIPGADKAKPQNPYVTVKEGEKIGDLQVVKIDFRSISLEKDGQVEVVKLFAEGKVVPPPPPVPTTPAAGPQPGQATPPSEAAKGQHPPGSQAPPVAPPGGNQPGVAQAPGAPVPPGAQRGLRPPGQMEQSDDDAVEDDESVEESDNEVES